MSNLRTDPPSDSIYSISQARSRAAIGLLALALALFLGGCSKRSELAEPVGGKELYARTGCGLCHGEDGRGDGPLVRAGRIASVDLGEASSYRYGRRVVSVMSVIEDGQTSGRGFMPPHAHLSDNERRELATFVLALSSEAGDVSSQEETTQ